MIIADALVQTVFDSQLYTLSIFCDDNYPDRPPTFQFNYKINLNFVDAKGFVCVDLSNSRLTIITIFICFQVTSKLPSLAGWQRSMTIKSVLQDIRRFDQLTIPV